MSENECGGLINYPYRGSNRENRMSRMARAAQFSPFAALTGYDDILAEASRITDERRDVSEDKAAYINECLRMIPENYPRKLNARITYFVPDKLKSGGSYEVAQGLVRLIDEGSRTVVFDDNRIVPIEDIFDIMYN